MSAAWVSAGASVCLLVVAVVAASIAFAQVRQNRRLREEEAAPYVVVDIAPSGVVPKVLYLSIANTGKTVARDVRVSFTPPLQQAMQTSGYPINDWSVLRDGLQTLTPGRNVVAVFDMSTDLFSAQTPRRYQVHIECKDGRGKALPVIEYVIDLDRLFGALHLDELGMHQAVEALRDVKKTLSKVRSEGLAVRTYSGD